MLISKINIDTSSLDKKRGKKKQQQQQQTKTKKKSHKVIDNSPPEELESSNVNKVLSGPYIRISHDIKKSLKRSGGLLCLADLLLGRTTSSASEDGAVTQLLDVALTIRQQEKALLVQKKGAGRQ